ASIGAPKGTKFAFSMLEAPQLESASSRTVVRVWQSWETGFSRWQARQVRSPWQSKYHTDLRRMRCCFSSRSTVDLRSRHALAGVDAMAQSSRNHGAAGSLVSFCICG